MNGDLKFAIGRRTTLVWFLLVAATGFSWAMGGGSASDPEAAGLLASALVAIALVKVRLVIRYFMEVREAALGLRLLTDLWCLAVGAAILVLYWGVFRPPLSG